MKQRPVPPTGNDQDDAFRALAEVFAALRQPADVAAFLQDLCTPAELEALSDRWRVVPLLLENVPYREIHARTGVSVTTIGRVARCIDYGTGGYRRAARLQFPHLTPSH